IQYEWRESEDSDYETWPTFYSFLPLNSEGHAIGSPYGGGHVHEVRLVEQLGSGADLVFIRNCTGAEYVYVDRDGIVPLGERSLDDLRVPIVYVRTPTAEEPESRRTTPTSVPDWHRNLWWYETRIPGFESLLLHQDEELRARAAALAIREPSLLPRVRPLLQDAAPKVRAAAARTIASIDKAPDLSNWIRKESNSLVRIHALRCLQHSDDAGEARFAIVSLLENDEEPMWIEPHKESAEIADAVIDAIERRSLEDEDKNPPPRFADLDGLLMTTCHTLPEKNLERHFHRLLPICERLVTRPGNLQLWSILEVASRSQRNESIAFVQRIVTSPQVLSRWKTASLVASVRLADPTLDRLLATRMNPEKSTLKSSELLNGFLSEALGWRTQLDEPTLRAALRRLATAKPRDAFEVYGATGPYFEHEYETAEMVIDIDLGLDDDEDAESDDETYRGNSPLVAALLLKRWGDPDADRLIAEILERDPKLKDNAVWQVLETESDTKYYR
ncbi:MAG: HEAT repeat domain-containing protein, partial [Planctomycetota bacterium]